MGKTVIYTDGACRKNGKDGASGGFGVLMVSDDKIEAYREDETPTTNNRMELKAILYVMKNYGVKTESNDFWSHNCPIVYSDSAYAVNTYNNWMFNWAKNGWIKSDKKIPENLDIIKEYYNLYEQGYIIDLKKVSGHTGVLGNEIADRLATGALNEEEAINYYYKNI